jgi:hypothetical protein
VWRKHTTDPKTASAAKPVLVIEPLRDLLAELREVERNPRNGPILRGVKGKPLDLNMLAKRVIRPALAITKTTATATRKAGSQLSGRASIRSVVVLQHN